MNDQDVVGVVARVFAQNKRLQEELECRYRHIKYNETGQTFSKEETISFLQSCSKAIISLEEIDDDCLGRLPELRVISKYGVGLNNLDLASLQRRQIKLGWTPGVNKRAVAELTLAFALCALRRVGEANYHLRQNSWQKLAGYQLSGKTVGIIGCGHIGQDLVRLLQPFHCQILVHDIADKPAFFSQYGLKSLGLPELLGQSDIVTLHVPLDASTANLMGADNLKRMKKGAILINTARGGIVDELALKQLLQSQHLGAAAFDVFRVEPPLDRELINLPNFLATPHIGGGSHEAIFAMGMAAIEGLDGAQLIEENPLFLSQV